MKSSLQVVGLLLLGGFLFIFGWPLLVLLCYVFMPVLQVAGVAVALVLVGIYLAVPIFARRWLVRLGISHGPVKEALRWWVWGAYGLMLVQTLGWYALYRPTLEQTQAQLVRLHVWLWLGPMLAALLPAYLGFQRWQRQPRED